MWARPLTSPGLRMQETPQRPLAGLLPHAAQRAGLQLAAEPAEPPLQDGVRPAGQLQQQDAGSEEQPGGEAAGEPQSSTEMTC